MTVVKEQLGQPGPGAPWPLEVTIRLAGAQGRPVLGRVVSTGEVIVGERILRSGDGINSSGYWELDLEPNSDIKPDGTTWFCQRKAGGCVTYESFITVPVSGGPFDAFLLEDDPLGTITPSALQGHAADLSLHGGGIEIDYKFISAAVVVTGSGGGLTLAAIPGLQITVPDLARAIMLHGHIPAEQQSGGPAEQNWGLFNLALGLGAFAALDAVSPPGLVTTTARHVELWARLPAHSPGNYLVGATGTSGNLTAKANASAIQLAFLQGITC